MSNSQLQRSVVLLKPDALQRGLVGEIINRFEKKGLKLIGLKMMRLNEEILEQWYAHHKEKPFFGMLKKFMMAAPVIAMLWEGLECVSAVRKLAGVTTGYEAEGGSIRGDYSLSHQYNIIHASDSQKTAEKEEKLIFKDSEIFDYEKSEYLWVYNAEERE